MENNVQIPEVTATHPIKNVVKVILWTSLSCLLLLGSAIALVFIYEDEVKQAVIEELNKNLKSEVKIDPKNIDLTFIKTFPKCAVQFKQVLIMEAIEKKERDTLIYADDILLMFNLKDIWNKNYTINKISISKAACYLQIDKKGRPNYIFWKSPDKATGDKVNFKLDQIVLNEIGLKYKNSQSKIKTAAYFSNSEFSGNFGEDEFTLQAKGNASMDYLTINKNSVLKNKTVKYNLEFKISNNNYTIEKAELALNEMKFSLQGNCRITDSLETANVMFSGKNLDVASVISLLPQAYSSRINDYESNGEFYCNGNLNYKSGLENKVSAEFGIKNASVTYKINNTKLTNLTLNGKLDINDGGSTLQMQNVSAQLGKNSFSGFCLISNFSDPSISINAKLLSDLQELNSFWPIDTLEYVSGQVNLTANLKGKLSEIKKSAFSNEVIANGNAELKDIKTKIKGKENEINIVEGVFEMANRSVKVNNFRLLIGKTDVELNGELPGFVNYLLDDKMPLVINAALKSNNIILEEILYTNSNSSEKKINIPANLSFKLNATIGTLTFSKFAAENIMGEIVINDKKILVNDLLLNTMDGKAQLSAKADASGENIAIQASVDLNKINISKLFYECNNFGQSTLIEKHLVGFATATVNFAGNWSKELKADLESVNASGNLSIEQGRLVDFKPLLSLSKYVEVNELKDIKFQTLQSNFEIKNQVISIPKTTIKNSAMNIELWGKHTFKNEIDYHIKLSLSELLANKKRANKQLDEELALEETDSENKRSVFLLMTGTVDNPIIKYDRKGLRQKIGEDLKAEKQSLKQILKEEFGLFKKDSTLGKPNTKTEEKFKIEFGEKKETKQNNLQPKKKIEEDDDDF